MSPGLVFCVGAGCYRVAPTVRILLQHVEFKTAAFGSLGEHPKYHRGVGSGCYLFLDVLDTKSK